MYLKPNLKGHVGQHEKDACITIIAITSITNSIHT